MKTIALIQARMGSTRLPGKVLLDLAGKPVLEHVVTRVQAAKLVDEVVVITTMDRRDLPIVAWCAEHQIRVSCGSEDDVLDRYYQAARHLAADRFLRITADCPLMDPNIIDAVIRLQEQTASDYANNVEHESFPDGLDVEVMTFAALETAWREAELKSEREHVTPFIRNNPTRFRLSVLDRTPSLAGMRWTLDQREDFAFITRVYAELSNQAGMFGLEEILKLLANKPELQQINGSILRNEGYLKSLRQDQKNR